MEALQYKYDMNGADLLVVDYIATTGASFDAGDLLQFAAGGTVERAVAASARIAGVAVETVVNAAAGKKFQVNVGNGAVYRIKYQAGTKTNLTGTDIGVVFDILAGAKLLNLDDTVGGMLVVVDYDNSKGTADVLLRGRLLNN